MSVTMDTKINKIEEDEIEVRLSDILQLLKNGRKSAIVGGLILLIFGVVYAFSIPNEYSSQVTVMPELQSRNASLGGLSSLAGLAGIDISGANGGIDAIRPDIYPDVLQSVPFALELLKQSVYSQLLGKETSLQTFIEEEHQQQSWLTWLGSETKESPMPDPKNFSKTLQITKKQETLVRQVHSAVSTTFDKKNGIITVTATLPDPVVAATVARLSVEYLTNYITSYRTEKSRSQVRFLSRQVEDAKIRYQNAEYELSSYRDRNRNLYLNTAKIKEQRLQADFMLTQNVFNEISKQLEQAKIKVSEEAPVFKTLEPARIPLKKSAPKRSFIVLGFTIVGFIMGIFVHGVRRFILN